MYFSTYNSKDFNCLTAHVGIPTNGFKIAPPKLRSRERGLTVHEEFQKLLL